jgi:hypothetical protein
LLVLDARQISTLFGERLLQLHGLGHARA